MLQSDTQELTKRELQIAKLVIGSLQNKIIARKLAISVRTVETHRRNIFRKLKCNSALSLMHWAIKNQILSENS